MEMLKEMSRNRFDVLSTSTSMRCRVFEDNSGALEMLRIDKYRPRTKHLSCRLHHFRSYVDDGQISIQKVNTSEQDTDMLTKPVNVEILRRCRKDIMGW